jgi:hypothetical protein
MNQRQFDEFVQNYQDSLRVETAEAIARDLNLAFYVEDVP